MADDKATATGEGKGPGGTHATASEVIGSLTGILIVSVFLLYSLATFLPRGTTAAAAPNSVNTQQPTGPGESKAAPLSDTAAAKPPVRASSVTADGFLVCAPSTSPSPIAAADTARGASCVKWIWMSFPLWIETRLFIIVLLAGALGATVHALRSLAWYVGNRDLVKSWLATYLTLPFVGAMLAAVFYLVIRGGLYSSASGPQSMSAFGIAAIAVLVGMFSTQASLKLKTVAETMLEKPLPGLEHAKDQGKGGDGDAGAAKVGPPKITGAERQKRAAGAKEDAVLITGTGFGVNATVKVNGQSRPATATPTSASVPLTPQDIARIDAGGDFELVVVSAKGEASPPFGLH